MTVTLLHHTPFQICSNATRTCWQSFYKSNNGGEKGKELVDRIGSKFQYDMADKSNDQHN